MANDSDKRLPNSPDPGDPVPSLAPELDTLRYLPALSEFDIPEARKVEFLTTLWDIMSRFVEIGVEMDVVSLLLDANEMPLAPDETDVLSEDPLKIKSVSASAGESAHSDDE